MFLEGKHTLTFNRKTFYWSLKSLSVVLDLEIFYDYSHIFFPKMDNGRHEKGAIISHFLLWQLGQLNFYYQNTITGYACCKLFILQPLCTSWISLISLQLHIKKKKNLIPFIIIANSSSFPQLQRFAVPRDLAWFSSCFQSKQWYSGHDLQLAGAWLRDTTLLSKY